MSVWGDEMDAIIALVRGAVTLSAGALGAERRFREPSELNSNELPHSKLQTIKSHAINKTKKSILKKSSSPIKTYINFLHENIS